MIKRRMMTETSYNTPKKRSTSSSSITTKTIQQLLLVSIIIHLFQSQYYYNDYHCESFTIGVVQHHHSNVLPNHQPNHAGKSGSRIVVAIKASTIISNLDRNDSILTTTPSSSKKKSLHDVQQQQGYNNQNTEKEGCDGIIVDGGGGGVGGGGIVHRITKKVFQNILLTRLHCWSKGIHEGLVVQCHPCTESNNIFKLLFRGQFQLDARLQLKRIVFPNIQFSGGQIQIQRMKLNLYRFLQLSSGNGPKYLNPFDIIGTNITMTQNDLLTSKCITNGLVRLLKRILTNRGLPPKKIIVESISIISDDKISIRGTAVPVTILGDPMVEFPFEVRSNIGCACRGHVVTFPGLEISFSLPSSQGPKKNNHPNKNNDPTTSTGLSIFVPIYPELTIDLGNYAQITSINIISENHEDNDIISKNHEDNNYIDTAAATTSTTKDNDNNNNNNQKIIQVSARVTITPQQHSVIPKQFQQSSNAFAAVCAIDVGRWVTKIGRFAH